MYAIKEIAFKNQSVWTVEMLMATKRIFWAYYYKRNRLDLNKIYILLGNWPDDASDKTSVSGAGSIGSNTEPIKSHISNDSPPLYP